MLTDTGYEYDFLHMFTCINLQMKSIFMKATSCIEDCVVVNVFHFIWFVLLV